MLYKFYIGSNNTTRKLEDKKAIKIISNQFEGFTVYKGLGYWQDQAEKSLIVEIESNDKKKILTLANLLKNQLKQETIALSEIGKMRFI